MTRVVDVQALDGLPLFTQENLSFDAKIDDKFCEWNDQVFHFESKLGVLHVAPATELEEGKVFGLKIQALTGLVYGCLDPRYFFFFCKL